MFGPLNLWWACFVSNFFELSLWVHWRNFVCKLVYFCWERNVSENLLHLYFIDKSLMTTFFWSVIYRTIFVKNQHYEVRERVALVANFLFLWSWSQLLISVFRTQNRLPHVSEKFVKIWYNLKSRCSKCVGAVESKTKTLL